MLGFKRKTWAEDLKEEKEMQRQRENLDAFMDEMLGEVTPELKKLETKRRTIIKRASERGYTTEEDEREMGEVFVQAEKIRRR